MHIAFIDEAGCTGLLPSSTVDIQPLLAVGTAFVSGSDIPRLTQEFLSLKRRYFPPHAPGRFLDGVLAEVKGADLRRDVRDRTPFRRRAIGFIDHVLNLLERVHAKIVARVWIKAIGQRIDGRALYTKSIQSICDSFQDFLTGINDQGIVIADGRSKTKNVNVAHSVFTQKFQQAGDNYNRIIELPTFGNSDNHVGLQIADLLCSALLFPIAAYSYCLGHVTNVHVHAEYSELKERYGGRLMRIQHRFRDYANKWRGGITVSDPIGHRSSVLMFR